LRVTELNNTPTTLERKWIGGDCATGALTGRRGGESGTEMTPPVWKARRFVVSGNKIHARDFGLSRFDFLSGFDLVLIGLDRYNVRVGCFVCDEPDFRLTNENMGRVCGTDGTHVSLHASVSQAFVHVLLRGSVNVAGCDVKGRSWLQRSNAAVLKPMPAFR
jgi:hypothetical protein